MRRLVRRVAERVVVAGDVHLVRGVLGPELERVEAITRLSIELEIAK